MTLGVATAVRNAKMNVLGAAVDAGGGPGLLRLYNGIRPITGGTVTTLIVELTFSSTAFATAAAGAIISNAITSNNSVAAGEPTWFRIVDSTNAFVTDGSVGVTGSGADLELNNTTVGLGVLVDASGVTLTDGDA